MNGVVVFLGNEFSQLKLKDYSDCSKTSITPGTQVNVVVKSLQEYERNPNFAARFDAIVYNNEADFEASVPVPSNGNIMAYIRILRFSKSFFIDGKVDLVIETGGKKATIT